MIKAIIFDWANVIASDGYAAWLQENVVDFATKKELFIQLGRKANTGELSEKSFVRLLAEYSGVPQKKVWPGIQEKIVINSSVLELTKQLKKHYKIGLLSNFCYEWLHEVLTERGLYEYFDAVLISSRFKLAKPHQESFQKILELLNLGEQEVIFIDDMQRHVEAARLFGIQSLLYTTPDRLKQDLEKIGIAIS